MLQTQELLRFCEETFLSGNIKTALKYAVSIAWSNPSDPEVFAHLAAYRIHVAAATKKTVAGEMDWYAVLGIDRCSSNTSDDIISRFSELMEMLDGGKRPFAAAPGAYSLIRRAIAVLGSEHSRKAYDLLSGYSSIACENRCLGEDKVERHESSCRVPQETQRDETQKRMKGTAMAGGEKQRFDVHLMYNVVEKKFP